MDFQGNPMNFTTLLLVGLAVAAVFFVLRKRYDSNVPLLFYAVALVFTNTTDRGLNPILLYGGFVFVLLLRFEFMSPGFTKVVAFFATSAMCLTIFVFLAEALGDGTAPF